MRTEGGKSGKRTQSARRQGSPYPKAEFVPRVVARLIDLAIASAFLLVFSPLNVLLGVAYLLFADGLPHGQSIGKRLMGLRVVHIPTRTPASFVHSLVRNLPIAVLFALNPLFAALMAVPVLGFELYMVMTDALGIRIGDIFSDTQVIDGKVPLEVEAPTELRMHRQAAAHTMGGADVGEPA